MPAPVYNNLAVYRPPMNYAVQNPNQMSLADRMAVSGPPSGGGGYDPGANRSILIGGGGGGSGSFNPYYGLPPQFNGALNPNGWQENKVGAASQLPTNVLDVRNQLSQLLSQYQSAGSGAMNGIPNFSPVSLNQNFQGPEAFQKGLENGIDYFGKLGISEGLQNINLQKDTANQQLANTLGKTAGNENLISVLQNQNLFKSQLGGQGLISQAQKDTAGRVSDQVNLQNSLINAQNQTGLQQAGFNQQGYLNQVQARLAALQPMQNLLEILTNLQGQGRGVIAGQQEVGSRNYKP